MSKTQKAYNIIAKYYYSKLYKTNQKLATQFIFNDLIKNHLNFENLQNATNLLSFYKTLKTSKQTKKYIVYGILDALCYANENNKITSKYILIVLKKFNILFDDIIYYIYNDYL